MSNFDFLESYDNDLYKLGNKIENCINTSPAAVKTYATPFLERVLELLLAEIDQKFNSRKEFYHQLDMVYREGKIAHNFKDKIYGAYKLRNRIHDHVEEMEKSEILIAQQLDKSLFYISKKLYRDFSTNYDDYKGVPSFKPVEIDTSDDEVELIEIPDFSEVIDMGYDFCIICGQPNHSNYSLCCEKCNKVMDNANNFITIRNNFGKNAKFTKEDLIDYGIVEGYVNQLVSSMVRENMLNVKGRYITFNNMHLEEYLKKIDNYISICELVTKFKEDKISPNDIKQTIEYKQGSLKQDPFYQFYKITNREIVKKFERDLLTCEDIMKSIEYTTITQKQLNRWYNMQLDSFKSGNVNESFVIYNKLLMNEYLDLKSEGMLEKHIKKQLNVTNDIYEFWSKNYKDFVVRINEIKKGLILKGFMEDKTHLEVLEIAGISQKEYDDLVKFSNSKNDEFSQKLNNEISKRKHRFVDYLKTNDLKTSCDLAKISIDDFDNWYNHSNISSDFYINTTKILMDKYLNERKSGKSKKESIESVGIKQNDLDYWFKRDGDLFNNFRDKNIDIIIFLILNGFKANKSKKEISIMSDVSVKTINRYLILGEKGSKRYNELYTYYEENIIPEKLLKFLNEIKHKSLKKSLESIELSSEELDKYYTLGREGDIKYKEFYDLYYNFKIDTYIRLIILGKNHEKALRTSNFDKNEFNESKSIIDARILDERIDIVKKEILDDKTTDQAAKKAGVLVDDIYDWYYKGKTDDDFKEFSDFFFVHYVEPNVLYSNSMIREGKSINNILKVFDINFTHKDFKMWQKDGLIDEEEVIYNLDELNDDEGENEENNIFINSHGSNSELYISINKNDNDEENEQFKEFLKRKKPLAPPSILKDNSGELEQLKKEILSH